MVIKISFFGEDDSEAFDALNDDELLIYWAGATQEALAVLKDNTGLNSWMQAREKLDCVLDEIESRVINGSED